MTYNFDPDGWLERERAALQRRHQAGELDEDQLEVALADVDRRYEEMLVRLDGSYEILG